MLKLRALIGLAAAVFSSGAFAVCLNPFGCEPSNLEECRSAAAKMPTELGVRTALKGCDDKFIHRPQREAAEKARAQALQKFKREEQRFRAAINTDRQPSLKDVIAALGAPPTCSTKPGECSDVAGGRSASQSGCSMHYWNRQCPIVRKAPPPESAQEKAARRKRGEFRPIEDVWAEIVSQLPEPPPGENDYWFVAEVIGEDGLVLAYEIRPPASYSEK